MRCEIQKGWPRFTWCPQDHRGVDHYQFGLSLQALMGREWGLWWLGKLDRLTGRKAVLDSEGAAELVWQICRYDSAEMLRLMYPAAPELFHRPCACPGQPGILDALSRCALSGSVSCLEALLDLGADPNGLDCSTGKNLFPECPKGKPIPVTPLDCALIGEHEDCAFLLELYGGRCQALCERLECPKDKSIPVTPLDCALAGEYEDCAFLLELYGGRYQALCERKE